MTRRQGGGDNTAYPLTDLMTSLMVIFVLLLLVFLNNQASTRQVGTESAAALSSEVRRELALPAGSVQVTRESGEYSMVTIETPIRFEVGRFRLSDEDVRFLRNEFPKLASMACSGRYSGFIEELNIEGESDGTRFRGASREDNLDENLQLSQQRAMEVVRQTLPQLEMDSAAGSCLIGKLTAGGRSRPGARGIEFKIKMRAQESKPAPEPEPAVVKVLELFRQLRATPRQPVKFRLSQEELNTYLAYALITAPRPGLDGVRVKLFPLNYVSTLVDVDMDELESKGGAGLLAPFHFLLNGKKQVWLDFRFDVKDGGMRLTVEKALYGKTQLPPVFARELLRLAGSLQPEHYDTSAAIPLPFHLRQLRTERGVLIGEN